MNTNSDPPEYADVISELNKNTQINDVNYISCLIHKIEETINFMNLGTASTALRNIDDSKFIMSSKNINLVLSNCLLNYLFNIYHNCHNKNSSFTCVFKSYVLETKLDIELINISELYNSLCNRYYFNFNKNTNKIELIFCDAQKAVFKLYDNTPIQRVQDYIDNYIKTHEPKQKKWYTTYHGRMNEYYYNMISEICKNYETILNINNFSQVNILRRLS